jgi:hypothetical protein
MSKDYPDISDVVHQLARIANEAADIRECLERANEQREKSGVKLDQFIAPKGDAPPKFTFGNSGILDLCMPASDLTIRSDGIGGPPAKAVRFVIPVFKEDWTEKIEAALERILGVYAATQVWKLAKGEKEGPSYVRRVTLRITENPGEPGQSEISIEVP